VDKFKATDFSILDWQTLKQQRNITILRGSPRTRLIQILIATLTSNLRKAHVTSDSSGPATLAISVDINASLKST